MWTFQPFLKLYSNGSYLKFFSLVHKECQVSYVLLCIIKGEIIEVLNLEEEKHSSQLAQYFHIIVIDSKFSVPHVTCKRLHFLVGQLSFFFLYENSPMRVCVTVN